MTVPPSAFDNMNIPLNIVTGDPRSQDTQGGAGVAIQHGTHIVYAIRDSDNYLTLLQNNLSDYQRGGRFESLNTWAKISIKDLVPSSLRKGCKADRALSIAALGDYVYVFWHSPDGEHRVLRTRPDMITQLEVATVSLPDVDGSILSNLAAFPLPATHPSLAGKLGVVALTTPAGTSNTVMVARVLDPVTFSARSTWAAQDLSGGTIVYLGNTSTVAKYNQLTASWIDQGLPLLEKNEAPKPAVSLVIHTHNIEGKSPSIYSYGMDLVATFDAAYRTTTGASIDLTSIPGLESAGSLGATFYTTPDGHLWTKYTKDRQACSARLVLDPNGTGKPGLHQPRWQPSEDYVGRVVNARAYNTPYAVFLPLAPTKGPSPCKVSPPRDSAGNSGAPRIYEDCTIQTFVECVLASDENHVPRMSTFMWGQTFRINDYIVTSLVPDKQRVVQLTMIADTFPVPVPATDIWGPDSPSGMVNWAIATYEYLVGNDTAVELDYAVSTSFGQKSSGNATVLGAGVQTEFSMSGGFATLASEAQQTCRASSLSVTTKGTPPPPGANPDNLHLTISAEGAYFGMTPPTRIGVDAYLVLPRGATTHSDVAVAGVHPDLSDTASTTRNGDYHTYCYTPGNLLTYDPGAINNRMKALYDRLSAENKQRFVIDGEDFGQLYSSYNYVDRIIEKFGSNKLGPSGGRPYLEFSFSETAIRRSEFQTTSSFTDGGTTFVDGSWYAGLGWDQMFSGEVGLLGCVLLSANLFGSSGFGMLGTQFSSTLQTRDTASSTWGLRLGEFLNPLAPGESYTVRMYLLKPSPLWATEMAMFGGASSQLDIVNSAPVRILFTVPYISDALRQRLSRLPA